MTTPRFIPTPAPNSGSQFGTSYITKFVACKRAWYNLFKRPFETGMGLKPIHSSEHLNKGSSLHEGFAAYYLSGCRDGEDTGEYDLDKALNTMLVYHHTLKDHYFDQETYVNDEMLVKQMLVAYDDEVGPGGRNQDYPRIKVLHDGNGEPLVETDFRISLGYKDYILTCRADLLIEWSTSYNSTDSNFWVMEHKSANVRWATRRKAGIDTEPQFDTELLCLHELFPEQLIGGVLVNIIPKGRGAKSTVDPVVRGTTARSNAQLAAHKIMCIQILREIDSRVEEYDSLVAEGLPDAAAADLIFPEEGRFKGSCQDYSGCEYAPLCMERNPAQLTHIYKRYHPRTKAENTAAQEKPTTHG